MLFLLPPTFPGLLNLPFGRGCQNCFWEWCSFELPLGKFEDVILDAFQALHLGRKSVQEEHPQVMRDEPSPGPIGRLDLVEGVPLRRAKSARSSSNGHWGSGCWLSQTKTWAASILSKAFQRMPRSRLCSVGFQVSKAVFFSIGDYACWFSTEFDSGHSRWPLIYQGACDKPGKHLQRMSCVSAQQTTHQTGKSVPSRPLSWIGHSHSPS